MRQVRFDGANFVEHLETIQFAFRNQQLLARIQSRGRGLFGSHSDYFRLVDASWSYAEGEYGRFGYGNWQFCNSYG
jgi:hypothetical protein